MYVALSSFSWDVSECFSVVTIAVLFLLNIFSSSLFPFYLLHDTLFWSSQFPFISFWIHGSNQFSVIRWTGRYCCLSTLYVGCATFFLPLVLGGSPNSFRWNRNANSITSEASLMLKVKIVDFCFCKPEVSGDSLTYVVKFSGEHVTFWETSLFWWGLTVASTGWYIQSWNTVGPSGNIFQSSFTAISVYAAFMNEASLICSVVCLTTRP
jgi:hypothetical protein